MYKGEIVEKRLVPNEEIISFREIDGEIVFLHKKERNFYELNETANFIWKALINGEKPKDIIKSMQKKFKEVEKEVLEKDVLDFIKKLINKKIFLIKK